MVSALSLAYFCNAWACWPTLFPKASVINRDGSVLVKTQQEGRFHFSELRRGLLMVCYENLVAMVLVRNHSTAQNHLPLPGLETSLGKRGPNFTRSQTREFLCRS